MDKLFTYDINGMINHLQEIEPEMIEACYAGGDDVFYDVLSRRAKEYISEIFSYMKKYYKEEEWKVANMLKELYLIATTGEVSKYQSIDDIPFEHEVFKQMSGVGGLLEVRYAAELLRYYYRVYEKHRGLSSWEEIDCLTDGILGFPRLHVFKSKVSKNNKPEMLSEDKFMSEFRKHMDRVVIGQDVLKKKLIAVLYQWIYKGERTTLLMVGPSGSGKNYNIEAVRSFKGLGRVVISYDCSSLTPTGFNGSDVSDIFKKLKAACSKAGMSTDGSIVYLDEIDKIVNFNHDSRGESINAMVQQQLLSSLAGTETILGVDTSKILFILGGAFPRIDDLKKEIARHAMGFSPAERAVAVDYNTSLRDQICAIGGEKEFVGRIEEIVQISKLTREDLKAILLDENIGAFTQKKRTFNNSGLELEIEEDAVESIVDLIEKEDAGARSVKNIMNQFADSQYFYDMKVGGFDKMIIHKGMLYGEDPIFITEKGEENEKRRKCS